MMTPDLWHLQWQEHFQTREVLLKTPMKNRRADAMSSDERVIIEF